MANCRDVAAAANVSVATVSYVFNPGKSELISPETRERVLAAAAELGYKPSPIGRSLSKRRTYKIGLLFSQHCRYSMPSNQLHILHSLSKEFVCTEYDLSIYFGWDDKVRGRIEDRALDGIILIGNLNVNTVPDQIARLGIPMVVVNRRYQYGGNIGVVDTDYAHDTLAWVKRLARQGRKRIFSISRNNRHSGNGSEIHRGIIRACGELGLKETSVSCLDYGWFGEEDYSDAGFIMFAQHLPDEEQFNAIVRRRPDAREIFASTILFSDQFEHPVLGEWRVPDSRELGKQAWRMMQSMLNGNDGAMTLIPSLCMDEYRKLSQEPPPHDF